MKKKVLLFITALVALLLMTGAAMAAENPIKVAMQLSQTDFTGPAEVTVSIKVSNSGSTDLPGPVKLFYPDGTAIEEFGEPVLAAGTSKSWTGSWNVTQEQLEEGKLTFGMTYSLLNDDGEAEAKKSHFSKAINYSGGVVSLEVNRVITPTTAGKGSKVTVTYELINTGTVEITDVVITEQKAISSKPGTIASIKAGEKASHTFTVTMNKKNLTSKASITYKANGESYTAAKEAATIKYGEMYLKATLTADKKGGTSGDTVKLTLTLKNSGKSSYKNLVVTDPTLGQVFTVEEVEAGKTVTLEKDITITESMDLQFTVKGEDSTGEAIETATERVTLTVINNDQLVDLHVEATVESSTVYTFPSIVKFRVYVTNNSTVDVTNVSVSASGLTLYTFPSILSGETRDFTRDVKIEMAGQYQFVASCKDQLNQSQSFDSNIVYISYSVPTAEPTLVPIPVPVQPTYVPVPQSIENQYAGTQSLLGNAGRVLLLIAIICGGLGLAGIAVRVVLKVKRGKAIDHLDESSVRNYETAAQTEPEEEEAPVRRDDTDPDPEDLSHLAEGLNRGNTGDEDGTVAPAEPSFEDDDEGNRTV